MRKKIYVISLLLSALLLSGCMQTATTAPPEYVLSQKDAYVFDDGTSVSIWTVNGDSQSASYRLSDGQELLNVYNYTSPDLASVAESEYGFENIEASAQKAVQDYYEKLQSPFDISQLLEDAYTDWALCKEEEKRFNPHTAQADVSPCIATERYIGFLTTVNIPSSAWHEPYSETSSVTLFDWETGAILPAAELFSIPEEDAIEVLANLCMQDLPKYIDIEQIKPLLKLDELIWFEECLRINLPANPLIPPSNDDIDLAENETETFETYVIEISYDSLKDVLQPWAIPKIDK